MSFKLKRKGEILGINEELSSYSHPVFEKNLGPNVIAEANRDGTTFVNKNASMAQKRDAIAHENVHHDQMRQGRLDYNNEMVMWKKKPTDPPRVYKRMNGHLMNMNSPADKQLEGSPALEWEAEANKLS
jgi:hypothetical protein